MTYNLPARLSWLFDLYIKSSLHVAFAVTAFAYISSHQFNLIHDPVLYCFIFSSTVVSYNLTKYLTLSGADSIRLTLLLKWIGAITGVGVLAMLVLLFFLKPEMIIASLILGAVTAVYALPVSENRKNLRNIYGIKILIIALVWAGVTVLLPLINQGITSAGITDVITEGVQRLLFVAVLILPFDIRDLRSDTPSLGTIPMIIGIEQTKRFGTLLLLACVLIEAMQHPVISISFFVLLFICVITALMIHRSMVTQTPYFASFWVEGIPIFWAFVLHVFKHF